MGPFDLSHVLGYPGQTSHPKVVEEIEEIVRKAHAKNIEVLAVIFSKTPDEMQSEPSTGLTLAAEASRQEATEGSSPLASGQ
jgi:2-keto-3-deoxy-L-rhamnonate aldolase RhmA